VKTRGGPPPGARKNGGKDRPGGRLAGERLLNHACQMSSWEKELGARKASLLGKALRYRGRGVGGDGG